MPQTPIPDEAQGLDMLCSSGTTGRPKGIRWPLPDDLPGALTMLVDLLSTLFGYDADTRCLSPAPLCHAAPLRHSMVTIRMGGTAFVMDHFDPLAALSLIERHRITTPEWLGHPGSVGRARLGVIHICNETGRELPKGQKTEDVLPGQPAVLDAAVFGVPNEDFGEEVKAAVQLVPG